VQGRTPAGEAIPEGLRAQERGHPPKGAVAGDAVEQLQPGAQPRLLRRAEGLHVGEGLSATEEGAKGDEEDPVSVGASWCGPSAGPAGRRSG
jgi:hypothetical protein